MAIVVHYIPIVVTVIVIQTIFADVESRVSVVVLIGIVVRASVVMFLGSDSVSIKGGG